MKKRILTTLLLIVTLLTANTVNAQAPIATPEEAITGLLNRIGGDGAANLFEIVIDASLAEDGKDVFIITSQNGKPCIKGNTQLSVATGINWYLNHHAHVNLTWNNLTTDLSKVELPLPNGEDKHVCNTTYRYNFNTCTFSYSMAFWTWERWQQEIDWMALHGINAPLNLVGLDVVTRKFLRELGVSENDINAYIAGPGFIAWFAMNNLEGWGGTINANDVNMNGNPDWWYNRQEKLCRNMLQRMRELGMQPVIPGFSGQVPDCIRNYNGKIDGFSSSHVINNGTWAGGYTRPDMLIPNTDSYKKFAEVYYKHLHEVMGISEFYSIDPFHEGGIPDGVTNETCYPYIMAELDTYYNGVSNEIKKNYNAPAQPKWIIQYWQNIPQSGAFSAMSSDSYKERFIGLDLFADNIYAGNAAKWRDANINTCYYKGRPYIYCMLHNFGGRSGMHGRLETTMNGYFEALNKGNNCQGIGATPEGIETNPILYDMLFELPWMDPTTRPSADEWLAEYSHSRYGIKNDTALSALQYLKKSVWNCQRNQQGTSEAIILGRPRWTFGDAQRNDGTTLEGRSVSSWSFSSIYWDTQDVLLAADQLYSIKDLVKTEDGIANFDYDFIEVVRQSMVDYAAKLLPLIKEARNSGNNTEYERLYNLFLQLMLDLDEMLSYDENFKLERWTSLARNIANEANGTNINDRNWLEWNARTQVTVWSFSNSGLNDYSNRCWASLIKDFHYPRWEYFFKNNGTVKDGNWFTSEKAWTVNYTDYDYSTVTIPDDMTATEKAAETFNTYFGRVKGATKNYVFPMGVTTNATKSDVIPEIYRGQEVELPLIIGKNVTISNVWIDLNNDGNAGNGETLTANGNNVTIPADAAIGKTTAKVTYSDGTVITFNIALVEDITEERTVAVVSDGNGSVAIEGTYASSITNAEAVKITATANIGYNFEKWTDSKDNTVSNDNPFIYYGKEEATFTANFIQDKWGVPTEDKSDWGDANVKTSFVNELTFAYYNREPETIYEAETAPETLFNTVPQIINIPQGASFDIAWSDNNDNGLKYCYLSAYIDYDGDGEFELLETKGIRTPNLANDGNNNLSVCEGKIKVLLPYNTPLGITHLRLRFDGGWKTENFNSTTNAYEAKATLNRMCYEVILNVTEGSEKAAHIDVASNNDEWGTAEIWTEETPGWTASNNWDVSTGIYAQFKATKASEDVEFLGWYDHYDRLVTTELKFSMLAKEDATYTARFRKFLEIDGWQIEYRTEQGATTTNTLATGVKPQNGKTYYIAADAKQSDNSFVSYYLYDNNGTLKTTTATNGDNYLWTCIVNSDGTYSFQNASGKYLANNNDYHLSIGNTPAKYAFETANAGTGVALTNVSDGYTGSKWMVTKSDGSAFNKNSVSVNNGSWCNDYIFVEVATPDVIVFTKVRQSGVNDLVIPETVEILGEELIIAGFDNNLFNNNKDLWSITLPKTMEFLGNNVIFESSLKGENTPVNNSDKSPSELTQVIDLKGLVLKNSEHWKIEIKYSSDGVSSYNQWGSFLLCPGSTWGGAELLYLTTAKQDSRGWHLRSPASGLGDDYFKEHTIGKVSNFTVTFENKGTGKAVIAVTNSEGAIQTSTEFAFTVDNISAFCARIPKGLDITSFKIMDKEVVNPFSGCKNLDKIAIDGDCKNYYVAQDGGLYNSSDVLVCMPEGKEKGADSRALAELIEDMETLTSLVATYNPVGKANKITLQTSDPNAVGYLWTNSSDPDEGDIADLVDGIKGNNDNFFHSNWHSSGTSEGYHYIEVDLGENNTYSILQFAYHTRTNCSNDFPDAITVMGSNDKTNYTDLHVENQNLPQAVNKNFTSAAFDCGKAYRYLRFKVTAERKYWHMGEFELYHMTSTADVFSYLEGGITDEQAATAYDALLDAIYIFDNGTTADEMVAAETALQSAYNTLKDLLERAIPVKLTTDETNPILYKIFIKRTADVTVLRYDEPTKMVAVENTANNNSWQAWYFMGGTKGVTIHPYNADGKVLSADNTSNNPAKVWAVEKGEKAFYEWKFVSQADGYYNIQARDGSNYFSNNGGTTNKMGFWSGDPDTDGGSLFKFVDAEFENDNARYYQLSDFKEANITIDGTNIYGGTSVGLYTGGKEYREAYTAANTLITAGNTSNSTECYNAYKTLRVANENLSYNEADPEKLYYIISKAANDYCKEKYVYSPCEPTTRRRGNYTGTHDQKHLIFDAKTDINQPSLAVFQFEATNTQGEYKMKNLHTGLYVKAFAGTHMGNSEPAVVKIAGYADGQVTLRIGENKPMHAQQDYGVIVQWDAAANNASLWTIDEVTNLQEIAYNTTISDLEENYGYSTLYLNYDVTIPAGISAYRADNIDEGYIHMEEINDGIIPANTPVILKGNPGTFIFRYTDETGTETTNIGEGFEFKGTLYDTYIKEEPNTKYYVLSMKNGSIGMYRTMINKDADGNAGNTHFLNNANKLYLKVPEGSTIAMSNFIKFSFDNDIVTDIEDFKEESDASVIYDLQGRKLNTITEPGLYIINGNKVFIK